MYAVLLAAHVVVPQRVVRVRQARLLDQALGEFTRAGSVHWQARVWEFLGQAAEEDGNALRARDCYERSLALYAPVSESDARRLRTRLPAAGTESS